MSGEEFDEQKLKEYKGVKLKSVFTINYKGYATMSSAVSVTVSAVFEKNDVVHIHAEGPVFMCWLSKFFGKRIVVIVHGIDY